VDECEPLPVVSLIIIRMMYRRWHVSYVFCVADHQGPTNLAPRVT